MNRVAGYPFKRMTTILRPDFNPWKDDKGRSLRERRMPRISDYIRVPVVATHGIWNFGECMSFEDLAKLAIAEKRIMRK